MVVCPRPSHADDLLAGEGLEDRDRQRGLGPEEEGQAAGERRLPVGLTRLGRPPRRFLVGLGRTSRANRIRCL